MITERRLAGNLHDSRIAAGLTQEDLAKRARVSQSLVSKIEAKKLEDYPVSDEYLARIAEVLGTDIATLKEPRFVTVPGVPLSRTPVRPAVYVNEAVGSVQRDAPPDGPAEVPEEILGTIEGMIGRAFDPERHSVRDTHAVLGLITSTTGRDGGSGAEVARNLAELPPDAMLDTLRVWLDGAAALRKKQTPVTFATILFAVTAKTHSGKTGEGP